MKFQPAEYLYLFRYIHRMLLCIMLVVAVGAVTPSCSGPKKSASMRKIDRETKKNADGWKSKEVRKAEVKQKKQQEEAIKAAEKARQDGITRHRAFQTQETRDRMDERMQESNDRYDRKKEFFLVRWFRPKDDIEKIEKRRAKEVKKRMAATRKKAEKNNEERRVSSVKTKERTFEKPDPNDIQHGGGGTYKEGKAASRVSPSDYQHGGGGSYQEGKSSKRVKASDYQHGGGGTYTEGKSKSVKPASNSGNTKGTSPKKNPFSRKSKPKAGNRFLF